MIGAEPQSPTGASGVAVSDAHRRAREIASSELDVLMARYASGSAPLAVSFRNLVGPLPAHDLTHSVHPYPARLVRHLPRFLLNCDQLGSPGTLVLDPFCGSGTVLVEAMSRGRPAWGVDANPFARLLSQVKTTPLERREIDAAAHRAITEAKRRRAVSPPDVVNIGRWFTNPSISVLARFRAAIDATADENLRNALLVALSLAADRLSLRDRRIPVPVRRADADHLCNVDDTARSWQQLERSLSFVAAGVQLLSRLHDRAAVAVFGSDARRLQASVSQGEMQRPTLAVTSPPYGAAQKYIRSSSLSIGWLGLADSSGLSALERKNIGREHMTRSDLSSPPSVGSAAVQEAISRISARSEIRGAVYANYFNDMDLALEAIHEVLTPGGHLALVAAPNFVAGEILPTPDLLRDLAMRNGFSLVLEVCDRIRGRSLMTKRAASSGPPIDSEHVLLFRKVER